MRSFLLLYEESRDEAQRVNRIVGSFAFIEKIYGSTKGISALYVRRVIEPAIAQDRIFVYKSEDGIPHGYAIVAYLSPRVTAKLRHSNDIYKLHRSDWTEGPDTYLIRMVGKSTLGPGAFSGLPQHFKRLVPITHVYRTLPSAIYCPPDMFLQSLGAILRLRAICPTLQSLSIADAYEVSMAAYQSHGLGVYSNEDGESVAYFILIDLDKCESAAIRVRIREIFGKMEHIDASAVVVIEVCAPYGSFTQLIAKLKLAIKGRDFYIRSRTGHIRRRKASFCPQK